MGFAKPFGDKYYIGKERVKVRKITVAEWKELFGAVNGLPALVVSVLTAPEKDRVSYLVVALQSALDEAVDIVAVLTGIDREYIEQHADAAQLTAYITAMVRENDFAAILKNVKGVWATVAPTTTPSA